MDRDQLMQIFSDAHVIDVDLSRWDQAIVLYVLADHAPRTEEGRKPLFAVEFHRVARLNVEFLHLNSVPLGEGEHFQWMIDDFSIQTTSTGFEVALWGLTSTPRMEIACVDVSVKPVALRLLDEAFPGWDEPSRPLARPGIEAWGLVLNQSKLGKKR